MSKIKKFFFISFISFLLTLFNSCKDDLRLPGNDTVPEGEPATISLKVSVPSMQLNTRDAGIDPDSDQASTINDLWIGIFSKSTGKKTGQIFLESSEINENHIGKEISIDIEVQSGESFITGAANIKGFRGLNMEEGTSLNDIESILRDLEKWEDLKKLGGIMSNPLSTQRMGNIFMSGNYSDEGKDEYYLDENNDPQSVVIRPGSNNLPGCVHLQRVVAYNKFVLIPHEAINFTPVSWQVINVPGISYIYNHLYGDKINAGDNPMNSGVVFWTGNDDEGKPLNSNFYHNSAVSTDFDNVFETSKYKDRENYFIDSSFDFYLLENKH